MTVNSGNGYVLKNIWRISDGQRFIEAEGADDVERYYRIQSLTAGSVRLSDSIRKDVLQAGTYELEVHFTNSAKMAGTLTLWIPVVVTN